MDAVLLKRPHAYGKLGKTQVSTTGVVMPPASKLLTALESQQLTAIYTELRNILVA